MTWKHRSRIFVCLILLALASGAMAQDHNDVVVGDIDLSSLSWGPQTAVFDVTNTSEFGKIISVYTEIVFDGTYMDPRRTNRVNYKVPAGATQKITQPIEIPGNYGTAKLTLGVYDVVDTLDPLLEYQRVMEQPWRLQYHIPDAMLPYFQEEITLPPMVSNNTDFDTEFIRLFVLLLSEGKSFDQIAELTGCDVAFVKHTASIMQSKDYLRMDGDTPNLTFPVITLAEATEARALAETVADDLAAMVEKNIPAHRQNLKTLAMQKIIPPNEDDFMNGGSALYYTYPTVTVLLFWYDLGQQFIEPDKPLTIYENTDYCRAHIPHHMYAVQGGPYYNGTVFYSAELSTPKQMITFLDSIPKVWCIDNFENYPVLFPGLQWKWVDSIAPEPFVLDTAIVRVGLKGIEQGGKALVDNAKSEFKAIETKYGNEAYLPGARYWFWNIVASRATIKLIDKGVIVRRSDGFFTYEKL